MSKELPYFKFFPAEWMKGDITLCSMETQGVFINLCTYYWMKEGSICLANAKQRFSNHLQMLNELIEKEILTIDQNEKIVINFLDEQLNQFSQISEKRTVSGRLGGLAKRTKPVESKCLPNAKQTPIYIEKEKEKEKDIKKINKKSLGEVKFPFISPKFTSKWDDWKQYKSDEHNFKFKSPKSEQAALTELSNLSKQDVSIAIKIIDQSLAKGWKGFFALQSNGQVNHKPTNTIGSRSTGSYRTEFRKPDITDKT